MRSPSNPWRTHSCVPRRDSSRCLFVPRAPASARVPTRHRRVRPPHFPVLFLAASAALFAQGAPPADQSSAIVEGVVVNSVTGEPVLRAHVIINGYADGKQHNYGALTTAEGKFSVTGLPAGNYGIQADRVGFIFVFNQHGPNALTLKPGDHKNDVTLKLTPTGSISGTVVDSNGEPMENCNVFVESARGGQSSQTDAQGRFRIGGLMPGKYRIEATPDEPQTPPEIRTDGTLDIHYSQTYYPNSVDEAGAAKISVEPGAEAAGTQIRLVRTPIVRVGGRVSGLPPGAENMYLTVQTTRANSRGFPFGFPRISGWSRGAQVKKDGTFTLWRLAPGPYHIGAQWTSPTGQMSAAAPVDIVVSDSNIDGVELRMMTAANLSVQVEYENDDARAPEPAAGTEQPRYIPQVFLQGIDGTNWGVPGRVDAAGAFTVERVVPGRYHVNWNGGRGFVKSMRLGQSEIAGQVLDLSNGAAGIALTIVVSTQYGSVSGTVQSDGASTAGLLVVLLPDNQGTGGGGFQSSSIGADGSYSFSSSVIPGAYKLAVIAQDDLNAILQGGDEWDAYAAVTETVTIHAGDKAIQDLKILTR